ncbi:MAG: hypothetical protein WAT71_00690 [Ignavibacteria bacterium]
MKSVLLLIFLILINTNISQADDETPVQKFSKNRIKQLSDVYINNNLNIRNPVVVDIDEDGDFDILKFNDEGKVEFYNNTGSLEKPEFVLQDKNFDNYEMNTLFPVGIPFPVFLADRDGDMDKDIFGVVERNNQNKIVYAENAFDLDHYTLVTIILVLLIIILVLAIV